MFMLVRNKALMLIGVFVLSTVATLFSPAVTLAKPTTINDMSTKLGYYYALRVCVRSAINVATPQVNGSLNDSLDKYAIFYDKAVKLGGQFISADGDWDGIENCSIQADKTAGIDDSWVKQGINNLGYTSALSFLCDISYPNDSRAIANCNANPDSLNLYNLARPENKDNFGKAVGMLVFGNEQPFNLDEAPAALQNILYNTFYKSCQPSGSFTGGTLPSGQTKVAIKKYNPTTGSYQDEQLLYPTSRQLQSVATVEEGPDNLPSELKCNELPGWISHFADKAQQNMRLVSPDFFTGVNDPTQKIGADQKKDTNKTSCAIEGVGWIVCPAAGFIGMLTDGLFGVLTTLLSVKPITTSDPTYSAWTSMRNIANVAFVIAFLFIIFSQVTSMGIGNYGIKKMMPKLIVAAILVNISFFLCAIAVDASNILGYSLQSLLTNAIKTSADATGNNLDVWGDLVGFILSGGAIAATGVAAGLAIASAGGWVPALALLLPIMIIALFAILTVVLVLAARQALIILMIVISPLAFVAYLLPNTEDWFNKWRKLFMSLLLLFPIISVIFGGSQLAAAIIRNGTDNPLIYILSLAIQVVPFFLVPIIMKVSGGVLARFGGMINNPNKGPIDKLRKRAEAYGSYKVNDATARNLKRKGSFNRFSFTGRARHHAERDAIYSSADNRMKEAGVGYVGGELMPGASGNPINKAFAEKMAGSADINAIMQAAARGASAVEEIDIKELKAGQVLLSDAQVDGKGLEALLSGKDAVGMNGTVVKATAATTKAAASMMMSQGRQMDMVVKTLATSGDQKMQQYAVTLMQQNYPKAKEKQIGLTDETFMSQIASGAIDASNFQQAYEAASAKKAVGLTVDFAASQETSSLAAIENARGTLSVTDQAKIKDITEKVTTTPSARAKTTDDAYKIIERLAR